MDRRAFMMGLPFIPLLSLLGRPEVQAAVMSPVPWVLKPMSVGEAMMKGWMSADEVRLRENLYPGMRVKMGDAPRSKRGGRRPGAGT